jgi:endoglucanase
MANPTITSNGGGLLLGVNLAGAEFGTPNHVPGVFGTDYIYPTHTEIDYYAAKGMSVVRLPFLWERLQRSENGPLDGAELARLDDVVNYTTGKGLKIEIEPHNYGYGFGALIGSAQTPNAAFADLWGKLAFHYQSNPSVIFGLMNEPHDQSASVWLGSANAAIAAIRAAGASQEILVPGSYYDGAWTWTTSDNAAVVGTGVQDPAHNFAFEVHQYLDHDGSGHSGGVDNNDPDLGVKRLTDITQWAVEHNQRLFLGEVGVDQQPISLEALDKMLSYMQQHTNVWQGVTYWAGGPWWGDYMFSIEPQNGVDKPQMAILMERGGSSGPISILENTTAVTTVTATDPDTGQTLSYSISGGADAAKFIIGPSTGALSFVTAPNFELPTDMGGDNVYDVIVQVSDGHGGLDTQAIAVTVSDVVESNHAPTVAASDQTATRGQLFNASSLFSASDADGDSLLYFFYDNSAAATSGHFTVNGMVQAAGTTFAVTAAQLAQTTFTAGTATSDDLFVNAWDGSAFSGPKEFHVNVPANQAPTVTAPDFSASKGQLIAASSLFSANDANGDNLLYFFYDNSADPASGHFTVNGVVQAAGTTFAVTAAQLAQTTFTAGTATSDDLFVNVYDGSAFSGPKEFHVNVPANHVPTATASNQMATSGQILNASSLFSANDADGDNLLYFFYDNSADPTSGHFTVNGVVQGANTTFAVTAAQLAQTTFTAGIESSDGLFVNVYDGSAFSGPKEFHIDII